MFQAFGEVVGVSMIPNPATGVYVCMRGCVQDVYGHGRGCGRGRFQGCGCDGCIGLLLACCGFALALDTQYRPLAALLADLLAMRRTQRAR